MDAASSSHTAALVESQELAAYQRYQLQAKAEIAAVIRQLAQERSPATLYFAKGQQWLPTLVLGSSAEQQTLTLDFSSDAALNNSALNATNLILASQVSGGIKIQFELPHLDLTTVGGKPAFLARWPQKILRLQRREYFRLDTTTLPTLICQLKVGGKGLDLPVLDLSGGGVALYLNTDQADHLDVGQTLTDCRLPLPDEGLLGCSLEICSKRPVISRSGKAYFRLGCAFVSLPGNRLNAIQRFINRIERERKARMTGLL